MGLKKKRTMDNGVALNYWRVVSVTNVTNVQTTIEVRGYTSQKMRETEKAALEAMEAHDVYTDTTYYPVDYDETMEVVKAYNWLKEQPEFEGSEDA